MEDFWGISPNKNAVKLPLQNGLHREAGAAKMSIPTESAADEEDHQQSRWEIQPPPSAAHHPSAPPHELFDISTTVDPSYIISLIRKLLPPGANANTKSENVDACDYSMQGSTAFEIKENVLLLSQKDTLNLQTDESEAMVTANEFSDGDGLQGKDDRSKHYENTEDPSAGEDSWEEYGCILWDLSASRTHADLMVQNLILEVLFASLTVPQSPRITEISLGIIGNLACHESLRKNIVSTKGLVEIIVDQLFADDAACLCEAFRLLKLCLEGCDGITWAEALQPEPVLSRILWIAENTLNPQLIEKSVGLLLAVLESKQEVTAVLLPVLVKLGLPGILINLLAFEMSKLLGERVPERYAVLDLILRTLESLSVLDGYSIEFCSDKRLLQLINGLIQLPDKVEVANSCVTAAVLLANILTDADNQSLEIIQDLDLLQGLLDIFPFASDEIEARGAIWSIIARILVHVHESEMSPSRLCKYVSVLASKSDLIEEELLDYQLSVANVDRKSSTASSVKPNSRSIALGRIDKILTSWMTFKDQINGIEEEGPVNEIDVERLKNCCCKYSK